MYAIIDVETGGFSKEKNGLCEVAVIIVDSNFLKVSSYNSLIKPYCRPDSIELVSYKEDAMKVNGIDLNDLYNAPEAVEVAENLENLFKNHNITTIVGHNVNIMDKAWIEYFIQRFGNGFKFDESICTLQLARELKLPITDNKLPTLCEYFGLKNPEEHRALGDALVTYKLWLKLKK